MQLLTTKKTKRKFYDKWTHKVSLLMYGSVAFRMSTLENLEPWMDTVTERRWFSDVLNNKKNILDLAETLIAYDKSLWQTRVERQQLDIYTNDSELYEELSSKFFHLVKQRFEPGVDIPLVDGNVVKTKKLPHDRYHYKVFLLPHKFSKDRSAKEKYLDWIDKQSPRISISHSVKQWFMITDWNWDRRYIWVEDESTLLMLKLRNSDVCGKVYEYQLCDK